MADCNCTIIIQISNSFFHTQYQVIESTSFQPLFSNCPLLSLFTFSTLDGINNKVVYRLLTVAYNIYHEAIELVFYQKLATT